MTTGQLLDEVNNLVVALGDSQLTSELAMRAGDIDDALTAYHAAEAILRQEAFSVGFDANKWFALKVGKRLYPEAS